LREYPVNDISGRNRMSGKILALAAALLLSTQVHAQTNQDSPGASPGASPGVTSGPAAGSPASMRSPQAGPLETKHQRKAVHEQSRSVRNKAHPAARNKNDETGATGSSTPTYASPPR
jgi:hypothetical protein